MFRKKSPLPITPTYKRGQSRNSNPLFAVWVLKRYSDLFNVMAGKLARSCPEMVRIKAILNHFGAIPGTPGCRKPFLNSSRKVPSWLSIDTSETGGGTF